MEYKKRGAAGGYDRRSEPQGSPRPDAIVVCGFGLILPEEILRIPQFGCFGVHASLLPRWRGPAPVDWTIRSGDLQSGITIFAMTEKPDAGD